MTLFDLFFLTLALTTLITLCLAAALAATGHRQKSLRILRRLGLGALLYFTAVITVSLVAPRRTFNLGETQCFDDWCIAATSASQNGDSYVIGLRISSRARRVSQRERNLVIYLLDRNNHRYDPAPQGSDTSLSSLLQPGQSVDLTRTFSIPPTARDVNLVVSHGGFPIGWFIIGYDSWFRQPPLIRFHPSTNSL
jgi:hypothetical protein